MQHSAYLRPLVEAINAARVDPPVVENCVRGAQFVRTEATDAAVVACANAISAGLPEENRNVRWVSNIIVARLCEISDEAWEQAAIDWGDGVSQADAEFDFHGGDYNYKLIAAAIEANFKSISGAGSAA